VFSTTSSISSNLAKQLFFSFNFLFWRYKKKCSSCVFKTWGDPISSRTVLTLGQSEMFKGFRQRMAMSWPFASFHCNFSTIFSWFALMLFWPNKVTRFWKLTILSQAQSNNYRLANVKTDPKKWGCVWKCLHSKTRDLPGGTERVVSWVFPFVVVVITASEQSRGLFYCLFSRLEGRVIIIEWVGVSCEYHSGPFF